MSPFEIFRRNLKPLMVFLTLLALFAFVVLPAMQGYLTRQGGGGSDPIVGEIDGKPINASRMDYFTQNHQSTVRFLNDLATVTIKRGGVPNVPNFSYDAQSKQVRSVGIPTTPSRLGTLRTLQFASQARTAGFELDDSSIDSWLDGFTDGKLTDGEVLRVLMDSSRNSMGKFQLYDQLRNHLMASVFQASATAGVQDGMFPLVTPAEQWEDFKKINLSATVDAYGLLVSDFISKTNESPSDAEIQAVYEDGIQRYRSDQSPLPGFRQRDAITVEYVVSDLNKLIKEEKAKLTEEELRAEYERQIKGGEFVLPKEDADPVKEEGAADTEPPAMDNDEPEMKEGAAPATTDPAEANPAEAADAKPADAKPADDKPKMEDADAFSDRVENFENELEKVGQEFNKESVPDPKKPAPKADTPPAKVDTPTPVEAPSAPAGTDGSSLDTNNGIRLVVAQDDPPPVVQDTPPMVQDTPPVAQDTPPVAQETTPPVAQETTPPVAQETTPPVAQETTPPVAQETTPAAQETTPGTDTPATPGTDTPAPGTDTPAEGDTETDTPRNKPFEEVKDDVARSLAIFPARRRMAEMNGEAIAVMKSYFTRYAIYSGSPTGEPPVRPNLKELAKKLGMEYKRIGPHDVESIAIEPIAQSFEQGSVMNQRGLPFIVMMFGVSNPQANYTKKPVFAPVVTVDDQGLKTYMSWKVDETEAHIPPLDNDGETKGVREQVVEAIRLAEARKLATEAAEKLADQINSGKTFEEVIPEDKKTNFQTGLGPFKWMESQSFQSVSIGNVPKLDSVHDKFMRAVFTTEPGKCAVAPNLPERVVYVVRPNSFQPHPDDLKEIFKNPVERMKAMPLGSDSARQIIGGFYQRIDEETGFNMITGDGE